MPDLEEAKPDRLGLTIEKLIHLYDILDYQRPENALVATANLLITELTDDEIDHGIHRAVRDCSRVIARDILIRAKDDKPIPEPPREGLPRLNAALAKAQGMFPPIPKTRTATKRYKRGDDWKEFTYNYADLADILKAIIPGLSANEIAFAQPFIRMSSGLYLVTQLRHSSGEVLQSPGLKMPNEADTTPQDFGGVHSYWRRYDASGLVGVSATEDDDGQFASRVDGETKARTSTSGRTKGESKVEKDKETLKPGEPNRGHGNEGTARPAQPEPATPAPTPIVTDEEVKVKIPAEKEGEEPTEKVMQWKKVVGRVKHVTGVLTTATKAKAPYVQVVVEGLAQSNRLEAGKPYQPAVLFHIFRSTLHDAAKLMPGKVCAFYFDPALSKEGTYYQRIEEILSIGGQLFRSGKPVEPAPDQSKTEPASGLSPSDAQTATGK